MIWKKDDVIFDFISDFDISMILFGSLDFSKVKVVDDGRYVCIVINDVGLVMKDFIFIIYGL